MPTLTMDGFSTWDKIHVRVLDSLGFDGTIARIDATAPDCTENMYGGLVTGCQTGDFEAFCTYKRLWIKRDACFEEDERNGSVVFLLESCEETDDVLSFIRLLRRHGVFPVFVFASFSSLKQFTDEIHSPATGICHPSFRLIEFILPSPEPTRVQLGIITALLPVTFTDASLHMLQCSYDCHMSKVQLTNEAHFLICGISSNMQVVLYKSSLSTVEMRSAMYLCKEVDADFYEFLTAWKNLLYVRKLLKDASDVSFMVSDTSAYDILSDLKENRITPVHALELVAYLCEESPFRELLV